jgi:hypothetical protein
MVNEKALRHEDVWGNGCTDPRFPDLGISWRWWPASRPGRFNPVIYWIGSWVSPGAILDDTEKRKLLTLTGIELEPVHGPALSQSLYPLRYIMFDV